MTKSRHILAPRRPWTSADLRLLARLYPDTKTEDLAAQLGRNRESVYRQAATLGITKSEAFRASPASGRTNGQQGIGTRFVKGQEPRNKGLRRPGWTAGRMAETQFKKGAMSGAAQHNYVPIGTERVRDGYLCRKTTDDQTIYPAARWRPIHTLVWEAANGPVPPGHCVVFRSPKPITVREAITLEVLELVSRQELCRRNSRHTRYSPEVNQLIQLKGALNRRLNRIARGTP